MHKNIVHVLRKPSCMSSGNSPETFVHVLLRKLHVLGTSLGTSPKNIVHVLGTSTYATFIMSAQLPFGFRTDLNHIEVLKALPVSPFAIAAAEVISAAILGCLGQLALVVPGILGVPSQTTILLTGAAFLFPFNSLLFGISSLLLLLFPFRLSGGGPDVALMGRVMIMMMGNLVAVVLGLTVAAIPAGFVFSISSSWVITSLVAWFALMVLALGNLFAVARAFRRFDIGFETLD